MKVYKIEQPSPYAANCYAVVSKSNNTALIDAPIDAKSILSALDKNNEHLKAVLLTHGHFDHIMAAAELYEKTGAAVYIHELDAPKLKSSYLSVADFFGIKNFIPFYNETTVADGDVITLDEISFRVMHTPGHTSGGVCYIAENVIFSGDTLFEMSVGRCDMPDGDEETLYKSLKKLSELTGNYRIYPGHGAPTELSFEKKYNPYLLNNRF